MAFSMSQRELQNPRYAVTRFMVEGVSIAAAAIEGTQYTEYCETFADVKARLRHHAAALEAQAAKGARFYWARRPSQWFADAVQTVCRIRRQEFIVAQATNGKATEWLTVIAL